MSDVTLTPVAGDPFNGGAQDLDPATAPPLTISLAQQQNAADMANAMGSAPMDPGSVALAQRVQSGIGQAIADPLTLPRDVMAGRVDPQSDQGIARTLGMASLMGSGLPMAEEGALGAVGGKLTIRDMIEQRQALTDQAMRMAQDQGSLRMAHADGRTAMVGADMSKPGGYRVTRFDSDGPTGHVEYPTLQDAVKGAVLDGFKPKTAPAAPLPVMSTPPASDPFAAMMAALDAHAPEAAADTGRLDPAAASWPLYHGTGDAWDVFDPAKAGARTSGAEKGAMFMSPREGEAANYAHGDGARVLPLTVTPGNTGVYDVGQLLATRDPRFMAASRAEFTGSQAGYDAALQRYDADVAYHRDLRSRMPADIAAEMPDYPAASNLLNPQSAAVSMARADGRDTAILRGLGESSGGDQVVALRPGFVRDATTGRLVYSGGLPIPGFAPALPAALQPNTPTPEMFGRMLREGRAT